MKPLPALAAVTVPVFLSSCDGLQSALEPHGGSAIALSKLIWPMFAVCGTVWVLVMVALAAGIVRRRAELNEGDASERTMKAVVIGATLITAVVIAGLTLLSFYTTRALAVASNTDLTVTVRSQQWWWQLLYHGNGNDKAFETANELHIPVRQNVLLQLEAADVIHSFWVPSLAGKQDLVPGRHNSLTIRAERPGIYRGQCAEFCGMQHSHMSFYVIAEDADNYRRWEASRGKTLPPREIRRARPAKMSSCVSPARRAIRSVVLRQPARLVQISRI